MSITLELDQTDAATTSTNVTGGAAAGAAGGMGRGLGVRTASSAVGQTLTLTAAKGGAVGALVGGTIVGAANWYKATTGCMTPGEAAKDTAIQTGGFGLASALAVGAFSAAAGIGAAVGSTLVVPLIASTAVGTVTKKLWDAMWYPHRCPGKRASGPAQDEAGAAAS